MNVFDLLKDRGRLDEIAVVAAATLPKTIMQVTHSAGGLPSELEMRKHAVGRSSRLVWPQSSCLGGLVPLV